MEAWQKNYEIFRCLRSNRRNYTNTKRALRDVANIDPEESSNGIEQPKF